MGLLKKVLKTAATSAVAGVLGVTMALFAHPRSPAPNLVTNTATYLSSPSGDSEFSQFNSGEIPVVRLEDVCPNIPSRPSRAPSHFIIQLGDRYFAIPANAIPANAIPANYIPSNFKPSAAIPANAIPANVIKVLIENYAIPSNFIEPNALANSSVTFLNNTQEIVDILDITKAAIPSNALPASIAPDIREQFALPASALPASAKQLMGELAIPANALPSSAIPSNVMAMQAALPASLGVIGQVNVLSAALPASGVEIQGDDALPASALPASALPASVYSGLALPASMTTVEIQSSRLLKYNLREPLGSILRPCQSPYENLSTDICTSGAGFTYCQPSQLDSSGNRILRGSIIFDPNYTNGVEFGVASGGVCDEQFTSLAIYAGSEQSPAQLSIFVDSDNAFESTEYQLVLDPPGETYSCQFVRVSSNWTDTTRLICTGPQVNVTASRASLYPAGKSCEIAIAAINLPGTVQVDNPPGVELAGPQDEEGAGAELAGPNENEGSSSSSDGGEETGSGGESSSGSESSGGDEGTEYGGPTCESEPPAPDPSEPESFAVYEEWCSCMGGGLQFPSGGSEAPPTCNFN